MKLWKHTHVLDKFPLHIYVATTNRISSWIREYPRMINDQRSQPHFLVFLMEWSGDDGCTDVCPLVMLCKLMGNQATLIGPL